MKIIKIKIDDSISENIILSSWEVRRVLLQCADTFAKARKDIKHGTIRETIEVLENRLRQEAENSERQIGKKLLELFLKQQKGHRLA